MSRRLLWVFAVVWLLGTGVLLVDCCIRTRPGLGLVFLSFFIGGGIFVNRYEEWLIKRELEEFRTQSQEWSPPPIGVDSTDLPRNEEVGVVLEELEELEYSVMTFKELLLLKPKELARNVFACALLGIEITESYSKDRINAAWRKQVFSAHPDRNLNTSSKEMMQLLNSGRETLLSLSDTENKM